MVPQPANGVAGGATPSRKPTAAAAAPKVRKSVVSRIHEAVKAIALCHNVTPVYEAGAGDGGETEAAEAEQDVGGGDGEGIEWQLRPRAEIIG